MSTGPLSASASQKYEGVGAVLASLEPTAAALRARCRAVGGRHVRSCLRGAGLVS
jgi:hypothetical protein